MPDGSRPSAVYDWILHVLGERELEKYESVVRETRPEEEVTWVIDRDHYDRYSTRRYSIGETPTVRIDLHSLDALSDDFGDVIPASDLEAHTAIEGDVRSVLEYYRVADGSTCDPVSHDGEMAVRKRDA